MDSALYRSRALAAAATLIAALGMLWPVLSAPTTWAIGLARGEGPAHLWGLWVAAEGMLRHGPFLRVAEVNLPAGFRGDLMDPINLLVFWPLWLLGGQGAAGAVLGWNAVHLAAVLVAGWGGWRLGRVLLDRPESAAVLSAATAGAPYLLGAAGVVGRSEYLPLATWALHLSSLARALQAAPARREQVGAILTLTALAWGGWQPLTWLVPAELGAAVVLRWRAPWRPTVARLVAIALPAALLTLPLLLTHLSTDPWWLQRLDRPSPLTARPRAVPIGALIPLVDATRSWANNPLPYLGLTLPVLAGIGAWRDRQARRWAALGALVMVFAMGEIVCIGTSAQDARRFYYMPAAWLMHAVPPLRAFHGWARMTLLAVPLLAVAAGLAVDRMIRARPDSNTTIAAIACCFLVLEGVLWEPVGRERFTVSVPPPLAAALADLPPGPILELPAGPSPEHIDQELLRAQLLHRPTSAAPSPIAASAMNISAAAQALEDGTPLRAHPCASSEPSRLAEAGFVGVVLHTDQLASGAAMLPAFRDTFGAPMRQVGDAWIWRIESRGAVPADCQQLAQQ